MLEVFALLARRYRFSIARNVDGKMCVYFCDWGFFSLHKRGDTALLRGTLVDISTRGDTAYSDEVVLVNVHNLFFGQIGSFRFSCEGIPL